MRRRRCPTGWPARRGVVPMGLPTITAFDMNSRTGLSSGVVEQQRHVREGQVLLEADLDDRTHEPSQARLRHCSPPTGWCRGVDRAASMAMSTFAPVRIAGDDLELRAEQIVEERRQLCRDRARAVSRS